MKKQRAIKRFFLTLMWLGVETAMVTIVTAAMRAQEAGVCKGYDIKIQGFKEGMLFTSETHIADLLRTAVNGNVKGQRKSDFNLPLIEDLLEQSSWVYNADLYFDNNNMLHVNVTERKPLARIFTSKGSSFYIDEAGKQIPLSDEVSLDLPVFTGFPAKKVMNAADSMLVQNVVATASFINNDPFWTAQIAQIDIDACGADCWNMKMVPVVGSHLVDLGDGSDIASKFHRLYLFYDQVLKRTGFDKYQKIDVQYGGQVIAVKEKYTNVDSIQLRKNIEKLLQQSRDYNELVQVAPSLDYTALMEADTSAAARHMYGMTERPEDSLLYEHGELGLTGSEATIDGAPEAQSTTERVSNPEDKEQKADPTTQKAAATPVKTEETDNTPTRRSEKRDQKTGTKTKTGVQKADVASPKKTTKKSG